MAVGTLAAEHSKVRASIAASLSTALQSRGRLGLCCCSNLPARTSTCQGVSLNPSPSASCPAGAGAGPRPGLPLPGRLPAQRQRQGGRGGGGGGRQAAPVVWWQGQLAGRHPALGPLDLCVKLRALGTTVSNFSVGGGSGSGGAHAVQGDVSRELLCLLVRRGLTATKADTGRTSVAQSRQKRAVRRGGHGGWRGGPHGPRPEAAALRAAERSWEPR